MTRILCLGDSITDCGRIEIWNKAVWNEKNVYDYMEEIAENMEGLGI